VSTTTPKLLLVKPDPTENVDIAVLNANADKIDAGFAAISPAYRNKIRNGDMGIAQRGAGPWTGDVYGLDGWYALSSGSKSIARSARQLPTVALGPISGYFLGCTTSGQAAASDFTSVQQKIENVATFSGQQVTLSFLAFSASGTPKIGIEVQQGFGTGGSPSADVITTISAVTISTTLTRYNVTFTVPSVIGKTLGSNGNDYLMIWFWMSAGTTYTARSSGIGVQNNTIYITDVQLEAGSVATEFERLPQQVQLAWCQRYFTRTPDNFAGGSVAPCLPLGTAASNTVVAVPIVYPVPMRAAPAILINGTIACNDGTVQFNVTAGAANTGATYKSCQVDLTCAGGTFTVGRAARCFASTAGPSVDFSAEL
jgi:hypothetical protein